MVAISVRSWPNSCSVSSAPTAADGSAGEDGQRVDVALVEHAQQHVDHEQRGDDQHHLAALRALEHRRVAAVARDDRGRHAQLGAVALDAVGRVAERHARREVERHRHRLQLADVVHRRRPDRALDGREARQRHQRAVAAAHVDRAERALVGLGRRRDLHDHLVAVGGRVDRRHLALAEGAVQARAHGVDRHAERVGAVAVDLQARLQALQLRVARHVAEERIGAQLLLQALRPIGDLVGLDALQDVLVLALAEAPAELQVLHRLRVGGQPRHLAQLAPQALDDLLHRLRARRAASG